jgi:hypothetical protein
MVRDIKDQAYERVGKDAASIDPLMMVKQQEQVLNACDMLGNVAMTMTKAELQRDSKVAADYSKTTSIAQHNEINRLKEQVPICALCLK